MSEHTADGSSLRGRLLCLAVSTHPPPNPNPQADREIRQASALLWLPFEVTPRSNVEGFGPSFGISMPESVWAFLSCYSALPQGHRSFCSTAPSSGQFELSLSLVWTTTLDGSEMSENFTCPGCHIRTNPQNKQATVDAGFVRNVFKATKSKVVLSRICRHFDLLVSALFPELGPNPLQSHVETHVP